jgi:membrane protease YdiL (CAAX protease family)
LTQNPQPKTNLLSLQTIVSQPSDNGSSQKRWGFYTVIVALLSGYYLLPAMVANVILLFRPTVTSVEQLLWQQTITVLSWLAIFTVLSCKYGWHRFLQGIGFSFDVSKRTFFWQSFQLLLLTTAFTIGMNIFWFALEQGSPTWSAGGSPYESYQQSELIVLSFFAIFIAPIQEELIFRGLIQSTLHQYYSPIISILLTCGIFLFFHSTYFGNIKAMSHVLILAICLSFWRERTRSILPGMLVHLLNNILASSMLLIPGTVN